MIVLFPAPLWPTNAAVVPPLIEIFIFFTASSSVFGYAKLTFLNSILDALISKLGEESISLILGSVSKTSKTL